MSSDETGPPIPATQKKDFWHEDFGMEVRQVAFEVEGKGFKIDATRLSKQSEFIFNMLFNDSILGSEGEGTVDNPIKVPNCTKECFTHFLKWFNHSPWDELGIPVLQGNLDILHISHMWLVQEGVNYAVAQLEKADLSAAQRLELARRYGIVHWLDSAIRDLLLIPLATLVRDHIQSIGIETFAAIACAKEAISDNRRKASACLPYPKTFDDAAFCSDPNKCRDVWFTVWIREICRLIHGRRWVPLADVKAHFENLPFIGMHSSCKEFVINSLILTNAGILLEEDIIQNAIREISNL